MRTHELRAELEVPLPPERVFAFFAKAENLEHITPPELRFRIVAPPPGEMRVGTMIEYRLSLYGLPFRWTTLISAWDPERLFVDEQIRGPYRAWIHTHTFERTAEGTCVRDEVIYALPFPPAGELSLPLIRLQLNKIFTYRQVQVIKELDLDPERCRWSVVA